MMGMWRYRWRKKVHVSYAVVCLTIGIVVGVVLAFFGDMSIFGAGVWVIVAGVLMVIAVINRTVMVMGLAILAGVILGAWRSQILLADVDLVRSMDGRSMSVVGKVFDDPDIREDGSLSLRLNGLDLGGKLVRGNLYATISRGGENVKRGDRVTIYGEMSEGFGSFVGAMWRATIDEIERPEPGDVARRVRDWFAEGIRQYIPEPEVDLGLGYLLGQRRTLPIGLVEVLKITGLTHIVVASGYNLTVLVRFMRRLFGRVSRFAAAFFAGLLVICFMLVTGFSPSMVRAGMVAFVSLVAWYYGRETNPVKLLVLVAAGTLMISPSYIVDLGWLLSFGAFAGVMILAPILLAFLYGDKKPNFLEQVLVETLAALVCTAPILIYFFSQISIVALIANVLILPTIPLAMMTTFLTGISALIVPAAAGIAGWLATIILRFNVVVMEFFGSLTWAMVHVEWGMIGVVVMYGAILIGGWWMKRVTRYDLESVNIVE